MTETNDNHKQICVVGRERMMIDVAHIVCFEAEEECTLIYLLGKEKQRVTGCLKTILALTGMPHIIKVHKSWGANLNFLVEIDCSKGKRIMKFIDGKEAEMSARCLKKLPDIMKKLNYLIVCLVDADSGQMKGKKNVYDCGNKKKRKGKGAER